MRVVAYDPQPIDVLAGRVNVDAHCLEVFLKLQELQIVQVGVSQGDDAEESIAANREADVGNLRNRPQLQF